MREDVLAGAHAEAARIVAEANMRGGGLALATNVKNGLAKPHATAEPRNGSAKAGPVKGGPGAKNAAKKRPTPPSED